MRSCNNPASVADFSRKSSCSDSNDLIQKIFWDNYTFIAFSKNFNMDFLIIMRCAFIFATSFTVINATVAHRLNKMDENGKGFVSGDSDRRIALKSADIPDAGTINYHIHTVPVHHFARHGLCRQEEGRKYFYKAIKTKLCQIKETFAANLVEDLCRHRGSFLDKRAAELFDIDGDGMVTHFEKRFYEFNT
ncbi:uncharacterized protein LOC123539453 [Mercenaria mercenaria]|uniref:uncharacterized protein LOC123539453 n=1 Tax=Mercenaria mercenaria TaxID=6596 RepID=UPI00234EC85E|nr:uncharacterized protein LOC123539453 [Mercenaria mercenaria]